jgi:hypothetical protein
MRLRAVSNRPPQKSTRFYYFSEAWQVKKKATAGERKSIFAAASRVPLRKIGAQRLPQQLHQFPLCIVAVRTSAEARAQKLVGFE